MAKEKIKSSYVCPGCGEKETSVRQWQTISIGTEFDLEKDEFDHVNRKEIVGNHESFSCPECGYDLGDDLIEKLDLWERI